MNTCMLVAICNFTKISLFDAAHCINFKHMIAASIIGSNRTIIVIAVNPHCTNSNKYRVMNMRSYKTSVNIHYADQYNN